MGVASVTRLGREDSTKDWCPVGWRSGCHHCPGHSCSCWSQSCCVGLGGNGTWLEQSIDGLAIVIIWRSGRLLADRQGQVGEREFSTHAESFPERWWHTGIEEKRKGGKGELDDTRERKRGVKIMKRKDDKRERRRLSAVRASIRDESKNDPCVLVCNDAGMAWYAGRQDKTRQDKTGQSSTYCTAHREGGSVALSLLPSPLSFLHPSFFVFCTNSSADP